MKNKIVLIDGHSILNRAFYGVPDLTNAEGLHTNAIYGFLNIVFKILDEEKPQYLTIVFDAPVKTFRHEMFPEYKGTRKSMPDELREQVPVIKEVLQAMDVLVIEKPGVEADDVLGTLSRNGEELDLQVVIISGDRDLLQLATKDTKIRIPKTKQGRTEIEDYLEADVVERYQVTPTEFIDVKALMGDASDNIPGVPSIGEKTATKIIVEYHSIEEAYKHVTELKPPRASKAMSEHYSLAQISKRLATIDTNVDLNWSVDEAVLKEMYTEKAYEWFQKLEFKNFLNRFETTTSYESIEEKFKEAKEKEAIVKVLESAANSDCIGVALVKDDKEVLPLFQNSMGYSGLAIAVKDSVFLLREGDLTIEEIFRVFNEKLSNAPLICGFELKDKLSYLELKKENAYDGTIAAYLLNPLKNDYTFKDVANQYLNIMVDEKLDAYKLGCYEAYVAKECAPILRKELENQEMKSLFHEIEMPLMFVLHEMETVGIKVEKNELKIYGDGLKDKIAYLEETIYNLANTTFNINSPKQLGQVLFEELGLPHGKKTKTGYSTSAEVLEKLAGEYPIVNHILEYRQLAKLKSTYADGLANYISEDGRIHGKFNQTITATGRLSSAEPNLQNIPIRMEQGRLIRKVFVPQEGYVFVDADYSQIELRILAHASGDEKLIEAYRMASDIHKITASQVFHVPFEEVSDLQRRNAKAVNFGIVYGISSFGLSQDLSITRKEASEYIKRYFDTYPSIKEYLDRLVSEGKEKGYVTTMFGRRRPVPELNSSNFMQRNFGERVAMNAPIQGGAADIIKIAMIHVSDALKENNLKSRLVLQVHDELLIETHKDEIQVVEKILKKEMEDAAKLLVKLEIDMHRGKNWYEAK